MAPSEDYSKNEKLDIKYPEKCLEPNKHGRHTTPRQVLYEVLMSQE